jgi:rRNA-processing protein FCF1
VLLVVEGAARPVEPVPGVEVRAAVGSGDDALVAVVEERASGGRPVLVATADRELRRRVQAHDAAVLGPRTLLDLLEAA